MPPAVTCALLLGCAPRLPPSAPVPMGEPGGGAETAGANPAPGASSGASPDAPPVGPPPTRRAPEAFEAFGQRWEDPYRWLEDGDAPEVQAWVGAQAAWTRARLDALPGREALRARLGALLRVESQGLPVRRGGRLFYTRQAADAELAVLCLRPAEGGEERVLLDPNTWPWGPTTALGRWVPSWDGRLLAFQTRPHHADEATLRVWDVDAGRERPGDAIEGAKYATPDWDHASTGFLYEWLPPEGTVPTAERPGRAEIRWHPLGEDPAHDRVLRGPTLDAEAWLDGQLSRDGRYELATVAHGWSRTDVWWRPAGRDGPWRPLVVDRPYVYGVESWGGRFFVYTNDGAPRYRVLSLPAPGPGETTPPVEAWTVLVPEDPRATLSGYSFAAGRLLLSWLDDVHARVSVHTLDGRREEELALPGIGSVAGPVGDVEQPEAWLAFGSYARPWELYRLRPGQGAPTALEPWFRPRVPLDPERFVVEQVWVSGRDGVKLPMFLLHRADVRPDGDVPTLLYGYGGFNISLTPGFSASFVAWAEAGGLVAVPNLRGGGEYGEAWHAAGMLAHKETSFDDAAEAAGWLFRHGWTRPERLAVMGGSNGGLLVGALLTRHPELFRAGVAQVPLLDMLRYHLHGSGRTWIPEYGDPEIEEEFRWLWAYSPYQRLRPGVRYPALLLDSAAHDDRVDPMHARKFAAALQALGAEALLRVEPDAGHGGAGRRAAVVEALVDDLAFLSSALGVPPATGARSPSAGPRRGRGSRPPG